MTNFSLLTRTITLFLAAAPALALLDHGLSHDQLAGIRQQLRDHAHASWEYGTASEAFLEIDNADLSVYGPAPFPPPRALPVDAWPVSNAKYIVDNKPNTKALMDDGAAGDPMSNGISVLLANATYPTDPRYNAAFMDQLDFIENVVPKDANGAISHRVSEVQLWADSVFMVPPILAYYGALQTDLDVQYKYLNMAVSQIRAYRQGLRDESTNNGLWHHVMQGSWNDARHWATGHGWAVSGILRVYQTVAKSASRDSMAWALPELTSYAEEIVAAVWQHQQPDGSLFNYLDEPGSFTEMSATALMAACTYRLALITDATAHIPAADKAFALVKNSIAEDGRLKNVVNPYDFTNPYDGVSPEGQGFVLMLQAAYRDFQAFSTGIDDSLGSAFSAFADVIAAAKGDNKVHGKREPHARRWGSRHH
ncbi:hypothetical protein M408DRAFT_330042 [Serendipita vermifera MAFF 305830]|uniref:Glycoside hydrolase family 105 protein n=1 Tax=Serendipita vermifera MAFF 305830 TaxID=933852 RepID=A0A0C3ASV4_SERVB|nr:hypothetical protein M408DRAFT_330042 [Serendipita vermifera MAFF 305830]